MRAGELQLGIRQPHLCDPHRRHRCPASSGDPAAGADADPYRALAAVLAAAGYGLDNKVVPPPRVDGNAVTDTDQPFVPRSLDEALQLMRVSELPAQLFTDEVVEHYALSAHHEVEAHRVVVRPEERRREIALQ